jgi:hypothetical protein
MQAEKLELLESLRQKVKEGWFPWGLQSTMAQKIEEIRTQKELNDMRRLFNLPIRRKKVQH